MSRSTVKHCDRCKSTITEGQPGYSGWKTGVELTLSGLDGAPDWLGQLNWSAQDLCIVCASDVYHKIEKVLLDERND